MKKIISLVFATFLVLGFIYGYIKDKSNEITFITQDKIYIGFFLVLAIIIIIIAIFILISRRKILF
mgnify:CR=1 FL=1